MTSLRIGLTGGIAAGKTEVQRILTELGVPVLDTDRVAHEVMKPGAEGFHKVVKSFGQSILNENGSINRKQLGEIVFNDKEALDRLNRLVHPLVGNVWRSWLHEQSAAMAVVSIPLLFECGLENEFDGVLCVWAPENIMKQRLRHRGLSDDQAEKRIRSQLSVDEKAAKATWVLDNTKSIASLENRARQWCRETAPMENP